VVLSIPISTPKHKRREANGSRQLTVPLSRGFPPTVAVGLNNKCIVNDLYRQAWNYKTCPPLYFVRLLLEWGKCNNRKQQLNKAHTWPKQNIGTIGEPASMATLTNPNLLFRYTTWQHMRSHQQGSIMCYVAISWRMKKCHGTHSTEEEKKRVSCWKPLCNKHLIQRRKLQPGWLFYPTPSSSLI